VRLHEHHSDPQDRIIIATALVHGAKLMSDDGKFSKYAELKSYLQKHCLSASQTPYLISVYTAFKSQKSLKHQFA